MTPDEAKEVEEIRKYALEDDESTFLLRLLDASEARVKELESFVMDCAKEWDCDYEAHDEGMPCRACCAVKLLMRPANPAPGGTCCDADDDHIHGRRNV